MPLSKERLLLPSILKWVVEPLRDLNIYNIHLLVGLFGNPNRVEYLPNVERGVDTSGILVLDYCNFKAAAIGAKDCSAEIRSTIQGDKGAITIFGVTNTLPEIGLTLNGQEEIVTNLNNPNHRMYDKFVAFEKMIAVSPKKYAIMKTVITGQLSTKIKQPVEKLLEKERNPIMHILHTTPRTDGFCMPAEFDRHAGCLLIWPTRGDSWRSGGWPARKAFAAVAAAIARSEEVTMLVAPEQYETARAMLPPEVRLVEMETDDSWARDVCPTFVRNAEGTVRGIDWGFNAWGGLVDGLYFPWDKDNHAARKVCDLYRADCYDSRDFILEGGSIHSDGEGTILTTESCLCSAGRNPDMTKAEIEEKLCSMLGAQKVLWLPRGSYGDETTEHVDNVCAFTAAGKVVLAWTDNQNDPQYALSKACADYLAQQTDAKGRKLDVTLLPIPQEPVCITQEECSELDLWDGEPTRTAGERLAASYVNFYIANDSVLVPQFGDPMDKTACEILSAQFPNRTIVPIAAREILLGGGNIHCITQQIPLGRSSIYA